MANSMWQQTEEMAKKHDHGGSLWLKLLNDGDKAVVVWECELGDLAGVTIRVEPFLKEPS